LRPLWARWYGLRLFFVVPDGLTSPFEDRPGSAFLFWPVEGQQSGQIAGSTFTDNVTLCGARR
jgi:hypothetical protein